MGVRCYYIALSLVIAGFGREFSSLKSRIQVRDNSTQLLGKLLGIQKGFGLRQYKTVIAISSSARLDRDNIPSDISKHIVKSEFLVEKVKELTEASNSGLKKLCQIRAPFHM